MSNNGESDGERESPPLRVDPGCIEDALREFLQPIKTNDPRIDFYTVYKREATEYDTDYVKKYDEDLNTTLIFAGLFSAVSSAFVIDIQSKLQPDPNEQSAALLRAILLTLNRSALPPEAATIPSTHEDPPSEIVAASSLMYASLSISLLAAFVAMLAKQWLNRYLRNEGGSTVERCGDRQRKCDGLEKWPLHLFVESLPVMLQISLLLLACGLCRHMWSINTFVTYILIALTALGISFYLGIVVAGTSSYECPFQTPVSTVLRGLWKATRRQRLAIARSSGSALSLMNRASKRRIWRSSPPLSPPIALEGVYTIDGVLWWPEDPEASQKNADDIRCVSWILRSITDPEAIDAAIRLAGTIRWFEGGTDVSTSSWVIQCARVSCFDSSGRVYSGSTDRAYYCTKALLQIYVSELCRPREFIGTFRLSTPPHDSHAAPPGGGLAAVLDLYRCLWNDDIHALYRHALSPTVGPVHLQWVSNLLLLFSWARRPSDSIIYSFDFECGSWDKSPPAVVANWFLVWFIFMGGHVHESVLRIEDRSELLGRITYDISRTILTEMRSPSHSRRWNLTGVLRGLAQWTTRHHDFVTMAYRWCSEICEKHQDLEEGETLLFLSLQIGFRHQDPEQEWVEPSLYHTKHHESMVDIVFGSQQDDIIADFLHAWTSKGYQHQPHTSLIMCAKHLVDLPNLDFSSPRLRRLVVRSVGLIGLHGFGEVGVESFVGLLNRLCVSVDDVDSKSAWTGLLLGVINSPEGRDHLSHSYWELLLELGLLHRGPPLDLAYYNPRIMTSLQATQQWGKLACWICVVWLEWAPYSDVLSRNLEYAMLLIFHQRPDSITKLEEWMERSGHNIPTGCQRIFEQARLETEQRHARLQISSADGGGSADLRQPFAAPGSFVGDATPRCHYYRVE